MAKGGYASLAWKRHLGRLANDRDVTIDDDVDFKDIMDPDEFRRTVAGEQIDIIRSNPPDSDATHPQPGAQQRNSRSRLDQRTKRIRTYLTTDPPNTRLAFVHEQVANKGQNDLKKRFYGYLRRNIQNQQKEATVQELINIAKGMTRTVKENFSWSATCDFDRSSTTIGELINWINYRRGDGPSVKIVRDGHNLTWDQYVESDRVEQNTTAPAPAANPQTPIVAAPGGAQDTRNPVYRVLKNDDAVLVFVRDQRDGVTVHTGCQAYYIWLLEQAGAGRQMTMREIIDRTRPDNAGNNPDNGDIRDILRNYNGTGGDSESGIRSCIGRWLQSPTPHFKIRVEGLDYTWHALLARGDLLARFSSPRRDRSPPVDERQAQRDRR
jgi:hypothetical protein